MVTISIKTLCACWLYDISRFEPLPFSGLLGTSWENWCGSTNHEDYAWWILLYSSGFGRLGSSWRVEVPFSVLGRLVRGEKWSKYIDRVKVLVEEVLVLKRGQMPMFWVITYISRRYCTTGIHSLLSHPSLTPLKYNPLRILPLDWPTFWPFF